MYRLALDLGPSTEPGASARLQRWRAEALAGAGRGARHEEWRRVDATLGNGVIHTDFWFNFTDFASCLL